MSGKEFSEGHFLMEGWCLAVRIGLVFSFIFLLITVLNLHYIKIQHTHTFKILESDCRSLVEPTLQRSPNPTHIFL